MQIISVENYIELFTNSVTNASYSSNISVTNHDKQQQQVSNNSSNGSNGSNSNNSSNNLLRNGSNSNSTTATTSLAATTSSKSTAAASFELKKCFGQFKMLENVDLAFFARKKIPGFL